MVNNSSATHEIPRSSAQGWTRLVVCLVVLGLIWLVVLPWIGSRPVVQEKIEREKARGINPDAMFYTELEAMEEILQP